MKKKMRLGSSAAALTISKMITMAMSIVTAMVLSRYLSLKDYGTYSELQTVTSLVVSIFILGLPNSLNYFLPTMGKEEKSRYLSFYYTAITVLSLVIAVVIYFLRVPISLYYENPDLMLYGLFLTVIPWTKIAISSRSNMLVVEAKVRREFVYCVLNSFSLLLLSLGIMLFSGSFRLYLNLYILIEAVFAMLVYAEGFISAGKLRFDLDWKLIKTVMAFSIPIGLSTAISTISLDLDKLVIGFFLDEEAVAIYANAGKELPFGIISSSFTAVVLPQIVLCVKEERHSRAVEIWKNSCELCFLLLAFCCAASIVFAPQIIHFLYSDRYLGGVGIFRVYALVLLLRCTYWGMILNAFGKSRQIFYNSIICLLVNAVLSVLLYWWIGFAGPALATFLSILAMAIVQLIHSSRLIGVPVRCIFSWKSMAMEATSSILSGLCIWAVVHFLNIGTDGKDIAIAIVLALVWAVGYFGLWFRRIRSLWSTVNS